ncbi:A-kinase anchor protein 10, mitochondrial [Lepeophtheirus salmonis]|uniref:A kinase (PRKA) anchor protein 10 [Chrysemys picta] n=1 Tax=Lepeophtheirus salmonis TaxID=72036 RepID=A0A0K2T786_LEPSM|nr:A-kinase anchor protein 10, mitochondrial-like [Lepeophtheirus salmonis]XP_040570620.1 A-kinase anchor protein 10, mitochondrial-like [Lepeophtheirus salmonis]
MPFPKFLTSSRKRKERHSLKGNESVTPIEVEVEQPDCCWLRSLTFEDSLENPNLNGAFISFLESRDGSSHTFKFWMEVRTFKVVYSSNETMSIDSGYNSTEPNVQKNQLTDALRIYQKYVAPNGESLVPLPTEITHQIIKGICTETGLVDPDCFTPVEHLLYSSLHNEDFSEFLRSSHYAKYLLEGGGPTTIRDILSNETLLFRFTEFLESEGDKDSLSFWMIINNFHEQPEALQGDALVIYERYVSMQATNPLGFPNEIRSEIEEQICVQTGSLNLHLFDSALRIVVQNLNVKYLDPFLHSSLFQNYISELKSTISSSVSPSKQFNKNFSARRSASVTSLASSCSDISTQNTLLAMSRPQSRISKSKSDINGKILRNVDSYSMNMDTSWDPNYIWRSMSSLNVSSRIVNIGEIDHLGRYISHFESPPSANPSAVAVAASIQQNNINNNNNTTPAFVGDPIIRNNANSKFNRVMRVLGVSGNDIPEVQEQLAWHQAEIIVKDIMNLTSNKNDSS